MGKGSEQPLALITGGAGFIGSHLADTLLEAGYRVRLLDNLEPQVHGQEDGWPAYLDRRVERVAGSVTESGDLATALKGVDYVYHFAARVGVGQSMYRVAGWPTTRARTTSAPLVCSRR